MEQQALTVEPTAIATVEPAAVAPQMAAPVLARLDVAAIQQRAADIEQLIDSLMVPGVHYGQAFPGAKKDSLLQAGAEFIVMAFGLVPDPEPEEFLLPGGHLRVKCRGALRTASGAIVGRMEAECSTMEAKFRWRQSSRVCPACGGDNIMRSKYPDRQTGEKNWWCNKKAGGCGAEYPPEDPAILDQQIGQVENPDIAAQWHNVRMYAQKRWLVAIARRTFSLSARFADDSERGHGAFDIKSLGPILSAIPGEKQAKWNRVVAFCLQEFGKPPGEITELEGAVLRRWLGEQIDATANGRTAPPDFYDGMAAPCDPPKETTPPEETPSEAAPAAVAEEETPQDATRDAIAKQNQEWRAHLKKHGVTMPQVREYLGEEVPGGLWAIEVKAKLFAAVNAIRGEGE